MSNKPPVLIVIDIQREYVTDGRPFRIKSIDASLGKAKIMLDHARANGWIVCHVHHVQDSGVFARGSEFVKPVVGFEPKAGEQIFEKGNFSCYSSKDYASFMGQNRDSEMVVIGYGSTMCCLSTIIEGYHLGHHMTFVKDASAAKASAEVSEEDNHRVMSDALKTFASVKTQAQCTS